MRYNEFIIGTKVMVIKTDMEVIRGCVGEVIHHDSRREMIGVRFDILNSELHTCNDHCEYGHGWYLKADEVTPCANLDWEFEVADEGDICQITGLPADYKAGSLRFIKDYACTVTKCEQCGEYHFIADMHSYRNKWYCSDCVVANGWKFCADCGRLLDEDNSVVINKGMSDEKVVCQDCRSSNNYFTCTDCGMVYSRSYLSINHRSDLICNKCAEGWVYCASCNTPIRRDESHLFNGSYYCDSHNPSKINIWNYSYKPTPMFRGSTNESDLFMGVELEIDRGHDREDAAHDIKGDDVYCKSDGSLGCNGIEIVTHPCTLDYHTHELGWDTICDTATSYDYKSHNAGTCGLHVHVNRSFFGENNDDRDYAISKVILFYQKFWDEIVKFSRRSESQIEDWSNKPGVKISAEDSRSAAISKTREERNSADRYMAVNLQNRNTVEFRVFRGTLKISTLYATLQFVDGVCRLAKECELIDMYNMTWNDVVKDKRFDYAELQSYFRERGLGAPEVTEEE